MVKNCAVNVFLAAKVVIKEHNRSQFAIGIPLLGSGTSGLSVIESCSAICLGIKAHFTRNRSSAINEILFVRLSADECRKVKYGITRHFTV
jgi:hypothetical protein